MKAKTITIVTIIFIIGFVLGMLTSAWLRQKKFKPMRQLFSKEYFRENLYKSIQPDEKQRLELDKVIDKYTKKRDSLQENFRKDFGANMKALHKELHSKLTREQIETLNRIEEERREWMKRIRKERRDSAFFHGIQQQIIKPDSVSPAMN